MRRNRLSEFNDNFLIEMNLCKDFVDFYEELYDTYGEEMAKLNNLDNSNLNMTTFIDNFVDSVSLNDVSPDPTANQASKDICNLELNSMKPLHKLLSFNKIFYETKKKYGLDQAKKWLYGEWTGEHYLHDAASTTYKPYCFAYDLDQVVEKGLFFIDRFKTKPANHLTTYNEHVTETISWLCNRSSGAVGLPSYLIYSWYFWNRDCNNNYYLRDPEYYRRQSFQEIIHKMNQPFLRNSVEGAFVNFSIMDQSYLAEIFGGRQFPDGTFAIDHIDEILEHQKVFLEVTAHIRKEMNFTFPVLTCSLLKDKETNKFVNEEFARWCSDHNMLWNDSNFFMGTDVTSLSNCCLDASQYIVIKVGEREFEGPIKILYQTYHERDDIKIFFDGNWNDCKLTAFKQSVPMYTIKTLRGREIKATYDHLHPTTTGDIQTHNLSVGDLLKVTDGYMGEFNDSHTYDEIISIDRYDYNDEWVFCVEVKDTSVPYFTLKNGIITHNCRLLSNTEKLNGFINSIGGTALQVGSIKVNTTNLRRIALESNRNLDNFLFILDNRIDTAIKTLDVVRGIIKRNIEKGLLKNYDHGLILMEKQYNTIGITAVYEAIEEFGLIETDEFGNKYYTDTGLEYASIILDHIRNQRERYDFEYSMNIECIPAERANVVLSLKDQLMYPNAPVYNLYSNQWIPLSEKCTISEKIRTSAVLDKKCDGGQITHINLDAPFSNSNQAWNVLNAIAKSGVIYCAFNTVISACDNNHSYYGDKCPECGLPTVEKFTRIVGFITPVSGWSKERRKEFTERTWFPDTETTKLV